MHRVVDRQDDVGKGARSRVWTSRGGFCRWQSLFPIPERRHGAGRRNAGEISIERAVSDSRQQKEFGPSGHQQRPALLARARCPLLLRSEEEVMLAPGFKYGDDGFCEPRGGVIFCGLTDAAIPWRVGRRKLRRSRARSIILRQLPDGRAMSARAVNGYGCRG